MIRIVVRCSNCDNDNPITIWNSLFSDDMCCDKCIRELVKSRLDNLPKKFCGIVKRYVTDNYVSYLQYILEFRPELIREHLLGHVHDVSMHQCEYAMLPCGLPEMEFADWDLITLGGYKKTEIEER